MRQSTFRPPYSIELHSLLFEHPHSDTIFIYIYIYTEKLVCDCAHAHPRTHLQTHSYDQTANCKRNLTSPKVKKKKNEF